MGQIQVTLCLFQNECPSKYEEEFDLHESELVGETHNHMKTRVDSELKGN